MPFTAFYSLFPDLAKRETRVLTVVPGADIPLPPGEYSFVEMFCDEEDCDCRRAFFTVISMPANKTEAIISWGWESADFYKDWASGFGDDDMIEQMRGPTLEFNSPLSQNARVLLTVFSRLILADPTYVERVKRHYAQFRHAIDSGQRKQPKSRRSLAAARPNSWSYSAGRTAGPSSSAEKVGRNSPCPCGSGKKFKHCCKE